MKKNKILGLKIDTTRHGRRTNFGDTMMKKLQVKTDNGWELVFCQNSGRIVTTKDRSKALPAKAYWAEADLAWFRANFANDEFRLA